MPFLDRHWWLRVPIALVPLCAVALIAAYVLKYPSQSLSDPPLGAGCTGVGTFMVLVFAFFLLRSIGPAHHRAEQRLAAITGNRDALPLAPEAAAQPGTDLPKVPFPIEFTLTRWDQPKLARLRVVMSVPLFVLVLVLTFLLDSQNHYSTVPVALAYVALYVVGGALHLWREIVVRPYIRTYQTPRRIVADALGIHWQPIVEHERAIRWDEMRLLEVMSFNATPFTSNQHVERRRYTLYTENSAIWWIDSGVLYLPPSGPYSQLLALITTRTGLEPRTVDDDLHIVPTRHVVAPLLVSAPPMDDDTVYLLASRPRTQRGRIIMGLIGLVLIALALLAGVLLFEPLLPGGVDNSSRWLYPLPEALMLCGGGPGILLLWRASIATRTRRLRAMGAIRVDHTGLSTYLARQSTAITWTDVATIEVEVIGQTKHYTVRSAAQDASIVWTEKRTIHAAPAPLVAELGFTPITSDELVALVMRMTGKPLTSSDPKVSETGAVYAIS